MRRRGAIGRRPCGLYWTCGGNARIPLGCNHRGRRERRASSLFTIIFLDPSAVESGARAGTRHSLGSSNRYCFPFPYHWFSSREKRVSAWEVGW